MNELVSVIIPIYNAGQYLGKCLDSITSQTYTELEIILINDGSSDDSGAICKSYADKDARIKYIEKENEGQSITRNRGIDEAKGKYLYFMDSDDYVEAHFIEKAISSMKNNNADVTIYNYYHVYDGDKAVEERAFEEGVYSLSEASDRLKFILNVFLPYKCGFEVWNRIYDADTIRKNNLRFPVFKPVIGEDVCFNFLYFLCAEKAVVSNERFYYYVQNENSTIAQNKGILQLNRYNEISKIGYEFIRNRQKLKNLDKNYSLVHILLVYHELMHYGLKQSKEPLKQIVDKEYFRNAIKIGPVSIFMAIKNMGIARGLKYSIYGLYYKLAL
jgi:glycosyltransferase involved in cell wall biosynthesis